MIVLRYKLGARAQSYVGKSKWNVKLVTDINKAKIFTSIRFAMMSLHLTSERYLADNFEVIPVEIKVNGPLEDLPLFKKHDN